MFSCKGNLAIGNNRSASALLQRLAHLTWILVFAIFILYHCQPVESIKCHICTSRVDKSCAENGDETQVHKCQKTEDKCDKQKVCIRSKCKIRRGCNSRLINHCLSIAGITHRDNGTTKSSRGDKRLPLNSVIGTTAAVCFELSLRHIETSYFGKTGEDPVSQGDIDNFNLNEEIRIKSWRCGEGECNKATSLRNSMSTSLVLTNCLSLMITWLFS